MIFKKIKNSAIFSFFILLLVFFGAVRANTASATDYEYLHIKLDTVSTLVDPTQLWQFHGFNGQPHNISGDGELNILAAPAGYQCGIWVVEEDAVLRDTVGVLWTKAGNRLQKGGTSISSDLADKAWNIGNGTGVPATDLCSFSNIDTGSLICDFDSAFGLASTINFNYGPVGGIGGSEDFSLSNAAPNTYRPNTDILCAAVNTWKTCDASSCVNVGANQWACNGAAGTWTNCTVSGGTCSSGSCLAATATPSATPSVTATGTPTATPTVVSCPTLSPSDSCASPGAKGENRYDPLSGSCKIFPVPCPLAYFCENGVCKEPRSLFAMLFDGAGFLLSIVISLAILIILIGGFRYTMSGGDHNNVESGKKIVYYGLLGLIIAGMSYAIVSVIYKLLKS